MNCRFLTFLKRKVAKFFRRIKQLLLWDELQEVYNGKSYKSYWDDCEELFGIVHRPLFAAIRVKGQARKAFKEGGFRPDEFFLYGLENKGKRERDFYLSQRQKDELLISFYGFNWKTIINVLKDKYVFYSYLKEFFKREVTYIKVPEDRLFFLFFFKRHNQIFVKQNRGNCGNGARIYAIVNEEQARRVFEELVGLGEWIVEEVIKQAPEISEFNPSSINTVRFPSFKKNGVVECVYPCMRFGRAGSIVDNAGQGGVFVSIDRDTGEIISDAYDEKGNVFVAHPDSKVAFRGFRVPQWADLIELVKKAHLALPDDQVYVAFDFALSEKGWCLVEGNWGDWILQQTSLKKGFKNEFVSFLNGNR